MSRLLLPYLNSRSRRDCFFFECTRLKQLECSYSFCTLQGAGRCSKGTMKLRPSAGPVHQLYETRSVYSQGAKELCLQSPLLQD